MTEEARRITADPDEKHSALCGRLIAAKAINMLNIMTITIHVVEREFFLLPQQQRCLLLVSSCAADLEIAERL
jgi:glutamine synthetase